MTTNKLNIALIGYGKMGKIIETLALAQGHTIGLRISSSNSADINLDNLQDIDVAIEFSTPDTALTNLRQLAAFSIPTVCGTTGWLSAYEEICDAFNQNKTPFIYASNFSIGVNIFFELNNHLAKMMAQLAQYEVHITESHHTSKKDAPSGTAVTLADQIIKHHPKLENWSDANAPKSNHIPIKSVREGDVKGQHEINYRSAIDNIKIEHEAYSREGFASGALLAAEFIYGKAGVYSMREVLGL